MVSQNTGRSEQYRDKGKEIAVPHPSAPQPAMAAPPPPPPHQRPAASGVPANAAHKTAVALEANSVRLKAVADRLEAVLQGTKPSGGNELQNLISALARGMDFALSNDHVPTTVLCLPPVIKQVYPHRNDTSLQPVISVLMIQTKNACMNGWFRGTDAAELITMANEQCNNFCMEASAPPDVGGIISKIMPRFYPKIIFKRVIVAFEAKRGYDVRMEFFHIGRDLSPQERIVLFVVQTDNLETSSCIISPPHVSFLVNGKGVEKRCNTSQDNGPQFPSDITKMLKFGTNIIQAAGYYNNKCLIAIAFVRHIASLDAPILKDYVQPSVSTLASDSELVEGPSRITLNCPISFRRIKTPVKGHLCKHHQCFDYDNFMEMNSRKPSWRCPCCNQSTCFVDLRIDQKMAKIIGDAGDEIVDVVLFADGSWKMVTEINRSNDQLRDGTTAICQDSSAECQYNSSSTPIDAVDLTMEDVNGSITNGCVDQSGNVTFEPEDRKPFQGLKDLPGPQFLSEPSHSHHLGNDTWFRLFSSHSSNTSVVRTRPDLDADPHMVSMVPNIVTTANVTDVSPARSREHMSNNDVTQHASQIRLPVENMQSQQTLFGSSIVTAETARPPMPRNVTRSPIAIQALPAQTQTATSSQRKRTNMLNPATMISSGFSSSAYRAVQSDGFNAVNCDVDMLEASRTSEITVKQNRDNQEQWQYRGLPVQQIVGLPTGQQAQQQIIGLPAVQQAQQQSFRMQHTMNQPTNILPQSSRISSMQAQQASQAGSGLNRRELPLGVNRVPPHAVRFWMAANSDRLQTTAGAVAANPSQRSPVGMRGAVAASNSSQTVSGSDCLQASRGIEEQHNWRAATGRMRGSLSGSAYESALNQYLVPSTQPALTVTSASDPIQQESFKPDDAGRQLGP